MKERNPDRKICRVCSHVINYLASVLILDKRESKTLLFAAGSFAIVARRGLGRQMATQLIALSYKEMILAYEWTVYCLKLHDFS